MGSKRKFGNCVCDNCGILFQKHQSEINRNLKLNRQNFCTRTCAGKKLFKNFGDGKNRKPACKAPYGYRIFRCGKSFGNIRAV